MAWGSIAGWLLIARRDPNEPSGAWDWLGRRAFAAYILHPVVLVGLVVALHGWGAPALVKFVVVGMPACLGTWLLADPFVRLPWVRQII